MKPTQRLVVSMVLACVINSQILGMLTIIKKGKEFSKEAFTTYIKKEKERHNLTDSTKQDFVTNNDLPSSLHKKINPKFTLNHKFFKSAKQLIKQENFSDSNSENYNSKTTKNCFKKGIFFGIAGTVGFSGITLYWISKKHQLHAMEVFEDLTFWQAATHGGKVVIENAQNSGFGAPVVLAAGTVILGLALGAKVISDSRKSDPQAEVTPTIDPLNAPFDASKESWRNYEQRQRIATEVANGTRKKHIDPKTGEISYFLNLDFNQSNNQQLESLAQVPTNIPLQLQTSQQQQNKKKQEKEVDTQTFNAIDNASTISDITNIAKNSLVPSPEKIGELVQTLPVSQTVETATQNWGEYLWELPKNAYDKIDTFAQAHPVVWFAGKAYLRYKITGHAIPDLLQPITPKIINDIVDGSIKTVETVVLTPPKRIWNYYYPANADIAKEFKALNPSLNVDPYTAIVTTPEYDYYQVIKDEKSNQFILKTLTPRSAFETLSEFYGEPCSYLFGVNNNLSTKESWYQATIIDKDNLILDFYQCAKGKRNCRLHAGNYFEKQCGPCQLMYDKNGKEKCNYDSDKAKEIKKQWYDSEPPKRDDESDEEYAARLARAAQAKAAQKTAEKLKQLEEAAKTKNAPQTSRIINTIQKSEFFKRPEIANNFKNFRDGLYRLKDGIKQGLEHVKNAEYLKWDHLHNEVEVYDKQHRHLGALDPKTLKLIPNSQVLARKL